MALFLRFCGRWGLGLGLLSAFTGALTPEAFDVREVTIDGVHNALFTHLTTCRELVSAYISRIEAFNPTINAVISLNPEALSVADELDGRIAAGNVTGSLFCIPILLKDNFDAVGMNTTGGCLALAGNRPTTDGPVVKAFREAGAVNLFPYFVLGKVNLHELALEGLSVSSLGGQTLNSYDQTRTPGGSSGGTGAAIAANFAVFGTGTDTVNSLRSPASANSLFSFRPTRGLISRAGVIPVSFTQDTIGAIARNPKDLAVALTVMASVGVDPADNVTASIPPELIGKDYSEGLSEGTLKGLRLGIIDGFFNYTAGPETDPVNTIMASMISLLESAGVTIVNITEPIYNSTALSRTLDVQTFEYREQLSAYLASPGAAGPHPRSFAELYDPPARDFLVIPSQYGYIAAAAASSTGDGAYAARRQGIRDLTAALEATLARHALDALAYPEQNNLVVPVGATTQAGRNGLLAALAGFPVVNVPAGFSAPTPAAPAGVPVGMELLGRPWTEARLLNLAHHVAALAPVRRMPPFANASVEAKHYETVPVVKPDRANIPAAYPVGMLGP